MNKGVNKSDRRPYCKPLLERVLLVSEEAVLVSCKFPGSSGPFGNSCTGGGRGKVDPPRGRCISVNAT